jgi:thiol-disulfide isomerase/thioredoxin
MALSFALAAGITAFHERAAVGQAGRPRAAAWLGVELDSGRAETRGVRVRHAVRSSPGWNAGIRDGDVIVRIDDVATARADDVIREVSGHAPGAVVRVVVLRAGAETPIPVTLGSMPDADDVLRLDKIGSPAPNWKGLSAVSGPLPTAIGELRGRVVIVDFWAAWCMACRMAAPKLSSWQAKFGAQGLSVIGITDDPVPEASQGAQSFGMKYAAIGSDTSYTTQRAFGVRALPTVFVIDKRGVVRDVSVGFDPRKETEMEALLLRLLAEPNP